MATLQNVSAHPNPTAFEIDRPDRPDFPDRQRARQGAQDRKLYIVPSRQLIVVRTGQAARDRDFNQQLWLRLMKAAPPLR